MKKEMLVVLISIAVLSSCIQVEEAPKTSGEVMKVAKSYWPGQFWVEIADEKGFFEAAGLSVELVDTNDDYFQSLQNMVDEGMDTNQFVLFDLIEFNLRDADLVAVMNSDISSGADGVVAAKDIRQVEDLKGKKIGIQKGTFTEFFAEKMLERAALHHEDIEFVEVESDTIQPFIDGTVDALVTWNPHLKNAVERGGGRILFDSSSLPGLIPDVHVFKKQFIQERPEDVLTFVQVWHTTTEFMKDNPKEAFGIIANKYGVSLEEVHAFTEEVKLLDVKDNKITFSYAAGFESLHGTARQINEFLIDHGITDKKLDSTEYIDARFIRGVE